MLTNLLFYKIVFAAEIFVAEFLFTFRLKKRKLFVLRYISCAAVLIGLILSTALIPVSWDNPWTMSLTFLVIFALTVPILMFCYCERWINLLFCAIAAYTLQHFSYELATVLLSLVTLGKNSIFGIYSDTPIDFLAFDKLSVFFMLVYLLCYVGAYWLFFSVYGKRISSGSDMKIKSVSLMFLIGMGLLTDILVNSFVVYGDREFSSVVVTGVSNMLCCVLLLYALFGLVYSESLQREMGVIDRLYREEKQQYTLLKENMDLINMKCHDMRHQIREIGRHTGVSANTVSEIEKTINIYDSVVKTGNETLDIILTEKSLRCRRNGIVLSCIADGASLAFMGEGELFSLFGNALDNAIEATVNVKDEDRRIVGFKIHAVGGLVAINVQNSFDGSVEFGADGLPLTTKEDKNYHGFGLKSMKYIVEKYGGDMFVEAKDGLFKLNILLPSEQIR